MSLEVVVQIIAVAGFIAAAFSYVVLRPLNHSINDLRELIRETRADLRRGEERRHELEIKVAEVDHRARSAHKRLDIIEGKEPRE